MISNARTRILAMQGSRRGGRFGNCRMIELGQLSTQSILKIQTKMRSLRSVTQTSLLETKQALTVNVMDETRQQKHHHCRLEPRRLLLMTQVLS